MLGMADWLVHQREGWQGGFAVASLPSTVHTLGFSFFFFGEEEEVGGNSERGEKRRSVKSTRSRLDSHLVAGSQCPCYLLHDSLPYLHQSPTQAGEQEGGLEGREGQRELVCVNKERGKEEGKEGKQTKK